VWERVFILLLNPVSDRILIQATPGTNKDKRHLHNDYMAITGSNEPLANKFVISVETGGACNV